MLFNQHLDDIDVIDNPIHFNPCKESIFKIGLKDPDFAQRVFMRSVDRENIPEIRYLFKKGVRIDVNARTFLPDNTGPKLSALEYLVKKILDPNKMSINNSDAINRFNVIKLLIKKGAIPGPSYDLLNQKIESYSSEKENFETSKYYKDIIRPVFELLKPKQLQSN